MFDTLSDAWRLGLGNDNGSVADPAWTELAEPFARFLLQAALAGSSRDVYIGSLDALASCVAFTPLRLSNHPDCVSALSILSPASAEAGGLSGALVRDALRTARSALEEVKYTPARLAGVKVIHALLAREPAVAWLTHGLGLPVTQVTTLMMFTNRMTCLARTAVQASSTLVDVNALTHAMAELQQSEREPAVVMLLEHCKPVYLYHL